MDLLGISIFGMKLFIGVILLAFLSEFMNAIFGGGHGTILTPLLILVGFSPHAIVPSVLLAEVVSGILVGVAHHSIGNINFGKNSIHLKKAVALGLTSIVGAILAVLIAIRLSTFILELYIGLLILFLGILILLTKNMRFKFSWRKLMAIGLFASFNKGISGAGYGPLITAGQLLTGAKSKHAVSISSLAKGLASGTAVIAYLFIDKHIEWILAPSLIIGAILSVPLTAFVVKKMQDESLRLLIGILAILLGVSTLLKIMVW